MTSGIGEGVADFVGTFMAWISQSLGQTTASYCEIETADSETVLASHQGDLISIIQISGVDTLIGVDEFNRIKDSMQKTLATPMSHIGHAVQIHFNYNPIRAKDEIRSSTRGSRQACEEIGIDLTDLFDEKEDFLARYTSHEAIHIVLWTRMTSLTDEQQRRANKERMDMIRNDKIPPFRYTQNVIAAIPDLREGHGAFVSSVLNDLNQCGVKCELMDSHDAIHTMRNSVDYEFTDRDWRPILPGDMIKPKIARKFRGDPSDVLWPSLSKQLMPRDAFNIDLKTAAIGDRIYSSVFIDLFPRETQSFMQLFNRVLPSAIPWRISFLLNGGGMNSLKIRRALSGLLSFSSAQNRLFNKSTRMLDYIDINTDDSVVKFQVVASTWAPKGEMAKLRSRSSQLARAIQGWGTCDTSEVCGDAFAGLTSSMLAMSSQSVATATIAPLSGTLHMLPLFRPSSPWKEGALLFRSPDGKILPYQPGSSLQTTWIDIIYARPGSGKSVLSNAINLALCTASGNSELPYIGIIDVGPSSSGLISLLKESLPDNRKHEVAYHRLRMSDEYSINPLDTQLGCRYPTPQDRGFIVNFITLLATPIGGSSTYDGMGDMIGMVVNETYKLYSDTGTPNPYARGVEDMIDALLEEIDFVSDERTSWWEVTDALFNAGFTHEASIAQRNASPLLSDMTSVCRVSAVEDLYAKITTPTGENLIDAFVRMVSASIREFPVLARQTRFDLGEARVISIDLDEVAKGGGDSADRQTAVMYMLSRYIMAKNYYLTRDNLPKLDDNYIEYHQRRIDSISKSHKRIVYDEFHRTANADAVRAQVVQDMREGRKWNVQVALISQSLDDFDQVMVEFATSVFILDAGPEQAVAKTVKVFGLSDTARHALKQSVHGPRSGGSTLLAQFATNSGMNVQLLTLTLGPIELWAFSTSAHDSIIRNALYGKIGPKAGRKVLAGLFPSGSASKYLEFLSNKLKEDKGVISEKDQGDILDGVLRDIIEQYRRDPDNIVLQGLY